MPVQKNNLTKTPAATKFKVRNLMIFVIGIVAGLALITLILIVLNAKRPRTQVKKNTIDDQIYNLSKRSKSENFDLGKKKTSIPGVDEETGLPVVGQQKLGEDYIKDLREILAEVDEQIKLSNNGGSVDVGAVKGIKEKAMQKVVPMQYQSLHIDLIFALDSIINGDVEGAIGKLEQIKNNI